MIQSANGANLTNIAPENVVDVIQVSVTRYVLKTRSDDMKSEVLSYLPSMASADTNGEPFIIVPKPSVEMKVLLKKLCE